MRASPPVIAVVLLGLAALVAGCAGSAAPGKAAAVDGPVLKRPKKKRSRTTKERRMAPGKAALEPVDRTKADAVYYAQVRTLEEGAPRAEAVAVAEGQIVYVGDRAGAKRWIDEETQLHDFGKAALFPGFVDAHGHLMGLGRSLSRLNLTGTKSYKEVLKRVRDWSEDHPGAWIQGRGWDQNDWKKKKFPTRGKLDAAAPDRPVALRRVDGHAVLVNSKALQIAGITKETADPEGGRILRDPKSGEPTGVLVDNAVDLLTEHLPPIDERARRQHADRAIEHLLSVGITAIHDAGTGDAELSTFEAMAQEGALRVRVYAMLDGGDASGIQLLQWAPRVGLYDHRLTVRAIKLFADGALGSRGAWLTEEYSDDPGNSGLRLTAPTELMAKTRLAHEQGYQVAIHAIGDAAARTALNTYEAVLARDIAKASTPKGAKAGLTLPRPRLEHAQVVDPGDRMRMASMKVVASMQPIHATSDMPWAGDRLGPRRTEWAYAWRSMLDNGVPTAFGSDCPVEPPAPLLGIYAAATRQNAKGKPAGGWTAKERVSIAEAVAAYTKGAAWAAFEEEIRGTLRPGKLADFTILDRDILALKSPKALLKTRVVATVVAGVIEHGKAP